MMMSVRFNSERSIKPAQEEFRSPENVKGLLSGVVRDVDQTGEVSGDPVDEAALCGILTTVSSGQ